mmetsp:Transcript_3411/g.10683  ORF Transcript_3411/g.10683 Transcript_3411/m.10683 type:complete len:305 (-) Transcript_3411:380-1294(-)
MRGPDSRWVSCSADFLPLRSREGGPRAETRLQWMGGLGRGMHIHNHDCLRLSELCGVQGEQPCQHPQWLHRPGRGPLSHCRRLRVRGRLWNGHEPCSGHRPPDRGHEGRTAHVLGPGVPADGDCGRLPGGERVQAGEADGARGLLPARPARSALAASLELQDHGGVHRHVLHRVHEGAEQHRQVQGRGLVGGRGGCEHAVRSQRCVWWALQPSREHFCGHQQSAALHRVECHPLRRRADHRGPHRFHHVRRRAPARRDRHQAGRKVRAQDECGRLWRDRLHCAYMLHGHGCLCEASVNVEVEEI